MWAACKADSVSRAVFPTSFRCAQFVAELVHNKCQRIAFDCSSPNGILLFREASRLLVTYGQHILTGAPPTYKDKYKGVSVCLLILSRALSGGYCNLGVFQVCCAPLSLSGLDPLAWSCSCRACARWLCRAVLPPTSVPSSRANRGGC